MSGDGTSLIENLRLVYESYGGWRSLIKSGYVWTSVVFTGLGWRTTVSGKWVDFALPILPSLAGFAIAAYAVYFAVLTEEDRRRLLRPNSRLGGRRPFLVLVSGVSHAVFVQILGILVAIVYIAKPFPTLSGLEIEAKYFNIVLSSAGLFFTVYGIILILGSVLSLFRVLIIKANISDAPSSPAITQDDDNEQASSPPLQ
jgi:hypothetical protein